MPESAERLGGRIPLLDPQTLTPSQRSLYDTVNTKMVPWAEASGFKAKLEDGRLIGPFNPILLSPEIAESFLALQGAEQKHTTLSERIREVVILTVGAVWKSDYERYAHSAVGRKAGLSQGAVDSLTQGAQAEELSETEKLAQRFTWELTAKHEISEELYSEAVATFGTRGIVDLLFLAGCYDTVSSILNTFRVPAP